MDKITMHCRFFNYSWNDYKNILSIMENLRHFVFNRKPRINLLIEIIPIKCEDLFHERAIPVFFFQNQYIWSNFFISPPIIPQIRFLQIDFKNPVKVRYILIPTLHPRAWSLCYGISKLQLHKSNLPSRLCTDSHLLVFLQSHWSSWFPCFHVLWRTRTSKTINTLFYNIIIFMSLKTARQFAVL